MARNCRFETGDRFYLFLTTGKSFWPYHAMHQDRAAIVGLCLCVTTKNAACNARQSTKKRVLSTLRTNDVKRGLMLVFNSSKWSLGHGMEFRGTNRKAQLLIICRLPGI